MSADLSDTLKQHTEDRETEGTVREGTVREETRAAEMAPHSVDWIHIQSHRFAVHRTQMVPRESAPDHSTTL